MRRKFRPAKTATAYASQEACKAIAATTPPAETNTAAQSTIPAPQAIKSPEYIAMLSNEQNSVTEVSNMGAAFSSNMLDRLSGVPSVPRATTMRVESADEFHGVTESGPRGKANRVLRNVMAARLVAARNLAGFSQRDAAFELGYSNSTQLSLAEAGDRLIPHNVLLTVCELYGVSLDYLFGVSDDPDVDIHTSARNAEVARIRRLLDANASAVAGVLLDGVRVEKTSSLRETRFLTAVAALCDGLDKFQAMNREFFDDAKGGALLLRLSREARESIQKASDVLDRSDRRVEIALKDARAEMAAELKQALP